MRANDFDLIAEFYDELVSWAPYDLWIERLTKQLQEHGLKKGLHILDAACGSGLSTLPLARRGYKVTGIDRSEAMLKIARDKARANNIEVELKNQDLLSLNDVKKFHAAICMHSGLDYILEIAELQKVFHRIRRCLKPGGLFAFDKCLDEPGFYRKPFKESRDLHGGRAVFEYSWNRARKLFRQSCHIYCIGSSGKEKHIHMIQYMRAVQVETLVEMVEKAGFDTLREPKQFTVTDPGMGIFRAV